MHLLQFADDYPGTVMWLQITNTSVDYPVMLGADNQFYLNHLPDGSKNALGSLFLDYRTNEDSNHLIIYGHNGSGGKMFGLLKRYESQDYWGEHPGTDRSHVRLRIYLSDFFGAEGGSGQ